MTADPRYLCGSWAEFLVAQCAKGRKPSPLIRSPTEPALRCLKRVADCDCLMLFNRVVLFTTRGLAKSACPCKRTTTDRQDIMVDTSPLSWFESVCNHSIPDAEDNAVSYDGCSSREMNNMLLTIDRRQVSNAGWMRVGLLVTWAWCTRWTRQMRQTLSLALYVISLTSFRWRCIPSETKFRHLTSTQFHAFRRCCGTFWISGRTADLLHTKLRTPTGADPNPSISLAKVTIRPGFPGTVLVFEGKSQKNTGSPGTLKCPGFHPPPVPISSRLNVHWINKEYVGLYDVYSLYAFYVFFCYTACTI